MTSNDPACQIKKSPALALHGAAIDSAPSSVDPLSTQHGPPTPPDASDPEATNYRSRHPEVTRYTATSVAMRKAFEPRQAGDFFLLEELGRGGMGIVYKARQVSLNRLVALKTILAGHFASEQVLERFFLEARATAVLEHPHVVPIYETGELEGQPFFTMPLLTGGTLQQLVANGPLPPTVAARVAQQVADGVQHAHEHGIIHRDIKPQNILLQRETSGPDSGSKGSTVTGGSSSVTNDPSPLIPRLSDFGLARYGQEGSGMTVSGEALGTPNYMPPEQAAGHLDEIGVRSDVYGLGAVLYCLLTGRPPFQSASPQVTLRQVREDDPVPPSHLNPAVPRDLETVCLKCLNKEPGRRYATARELADELGCFLRGQPVRARPVGTLERGWRWCRRNRVVATLLGAVAAALMLGTVVSTYFAVQASANAQEADRKAADEYTARLQADDAKQKAQTAQGKAEAEFTRAEQLRMRSEKMVYAGQIALTHSEWQNRQIGRSWELLEGCRWDYRGWEHRYLHSLLTSHQRTFYGHNSIVSSVAYSPNGLRLASGAASEIAIWDASTRDQLLVIPMRSKDAAVHSLAYSPDGNRLASGSRDHTVHVWDAYTGKELLCLKNHTGSVESLAFSPDGQRLASAADDHTVRLWDAQTGSEIHCLKAHPFAVRSVAFNADGNRLVTCCAREVRFWDVQTGQPVSAIQGPGGNFTRLAYSPDGKKFVIGETDGTVRFWDATSGKELSAQPSGTTDHFSDIAAITFSPDGKYVASAAGLLSIGRCGGIRLWDAQTGKQVGFLQGHSASVSSLKFSPDSQRLATGSADHTVKVWNLQSALLELTEVDGSCMAFNPSSQLIAVGRSKDVVIWDPQSGKIVRQLKGHTAPVNFVVFSADGKRLVSTAKTHKEGVPGAIPQLGEVCVWDTATGRALYRITATTGFFTCATLSPDGKLLACGHPDRTTRVLGLQASAKELHSLVAQTGQVTAAAFSPDSKRLATVSLDGMVRVWDMQSGKQLLSMMNGFGRTYSVAFSLDGRRLATSGRDKVVRVWDANTGNLLRSMEGHAKDVTGVAFTADGQRLASASRDCTVRLWDSTYGEEMLCLQSGFAPDDGLTSVAFSPNDLRLATCSLLGHIRIWTIHPDRQVRARSLRGHSFMVTSVAFSPDSKQLASGSWDYGVILWDLKTGQAALRLAGHVHGVNGVAYSPDGQRLVSASRDSTIKLWETKTGRQLQSLTGHKGEVKSVAYSPDGRLLASSSEDKTVKLWDALTGKERSTLQGHTNTVDAVAFSSDGRYLASCDVDAHVKLWEPTTGKLIRTLQVNTELVHSLAFSPDGKFLVTGGGDLDKDTGDVTIWDVKSGKPVRSLPDQVAPVMSLAFNHDGRHLVVSSMHSTILKLWDIHTGTLVDSLKGHTSTVYGMSFSADGRHFATGTGDDTVKLWDTEAFPGLAALRP
jgi:WD40 repeat protein